MRATTSATVPMIGGSVPHTTTSGRGSAEPRPQGGTEIRHIVERPPEQMRAVVGCRRDADDLHAVPRLTRGKLGASAQPACDDGDVEVLCEPFAKLREEVRGGLHSRPVVLVEQEDPRAHGPRLAPHPGDFRRSAPRGTGDRSTGCALDELDEALHARFVAPVGDPFPRGGSECTSSRGIARELLQGGRRGPAVARR